MYDMEGEVPDEPYAIPFGEANVTREGDDVTIVAFGRMVNFANEAADNLAKAGITCTVVDPRTTSPLDTETILETVEETGRLVVVDEAHPRCGMAADIAGLVAENVFGSLKARAQAGDRAARAGALLAGARGPLHPERRQDRGGGPRGDGQRQAKAPPSRPASSRSARHDPDRPPQGRWRATRMRSRRSAMTPEHERRTPMPAIQPITMPKWGLAMEEGTLARWAAAEGDQIALGQEIMDIETSKIANVFESPVAGRAAQEGRAGGRDGAGRRAPRRRLRPGVPDAEVDSFVADFLAKLASRGEGRRGRPPSRRSSRSAASALRYLEGRPGRRRRRSLLIHGFGADHAAWMFNHRRAAEERPVYAIDLPGHGGSSKEVDDGSAADARQVRRRPTSTISGSKAPSRRPFARRRHRGARSPPTNPDRVASLTLIAPAGLGTEIAGEFIDGFIAEGRGKKLRPVHRDAGRRSRPRDRRHGRGRAEVQAPRRRARRR